MWRCAAMKDTWLSRGIAAPRYPHRSLKHLCCLMSALPRGVYWWLPLIPLSWKKCVRRKDPTAVKLCVCVCVRVFACACKCSTDLSGRSLTLVVTVTPGSKLVPVAKQLCHIRSWQYQQQALRREDWGVWRFTQVDKNWLTIHSQCNSEKSPSWNSLVLSKKLYKFPTWIWEVVFSPMLCT